MAEERRSICSYCGCGCSLAFRVEADGRVAKVAPDRADAVSRGSPCIKGLTLHEVADRGRVLRPLLRDAKGMPLREATWDEALDRVAEEAARAGPAEVFVNASGKATNEDAYATGKFARAVLGTPHLDACCTRLCHAPTVEAMLDVLGSGATPHTLDDVEGCDVVLLIGTNPASNYPILFHRLVEAKRQGTRIAAVQVLFNATASYADLSVLIRPATELALLNGLLRRLVRAGPRAELRALDGYAALERVVEPYDEALVERVCGVPRRDLEALAGMVEGARTLGIVHGMGMTQHVQAVEGVHALLNLLLLKDARLLSMRGEVNVQGAGDMGCLPDRLPTGPMATLPELERWWGPGLPQGRGRTITEALLLDPPRMAILAGFNPAQSMPNLNVVHANLRGMFLVCMEHHATLTSEAFADVVLPVPMLWESRGTVTTGERRVRRVAPARAPPGEARPIWRVAQDLAARLGRGGALPWPDEYAITAEIVRVVPAYRGLDLGAVLAGEDGFADKRPRFRRFVPEHFQGVTSLTSARFPFLLTSFRSPYQFLTGEATAHSTTLARFPGGPCCYLNPGDAARLGVAEGQPVRVASAVDALEAPARLSEEVPPGVVGMHFHFRGLLMNKLFPTQFDARTFTPNFKVVAVRVEPAAADAGAQAEGVEAVPARGPAAATAGAPAAAATASTAATDAKAASAAQGPAGPGPTASAGAASPASARPGRRG